MWGIVPLVVPVGLYVGGMRRRRVSYYVDYEIRDMSIDALHDAYLELLDDVNRSKREQESMDLVADELQRRGWKIDMDTLELVEFPRRPERHVHGRGSQHLIEDRSEVHVHGRGSQHLIEDRPHEEHHIEREADEVHIHGQQQPDVHVYEQVSTEIHCQQPPPTVHIHEQTRRVIHHAAPEPKVIYHPASYNEVRINGVVHKVPINQKQALIEQGGPSHPAPKMIEQKKARKKTGGKGRDKSESHNRHDESEVEEYESEQTDRKPSKSKNRSRRPATSSDESMSEASVRGRQKNRNKSKPKPRSPSYSESDSRSEYSDAAPPPKKPVTATRNRLAIKNTAENKVKGFESDYASGSDTESEDSRYAKPSKQTSRTRGGSKALKKNGKYYSR